MDTVDKIIALENGELDEDETTIAMQEMINSGMAWKLQGSYGRSAMDMIEAGLCMRGEEDHFDTYGNHVPSRYQIKEGTKGSRQYVIERYPDSPVLNMKTKKKRKLNSK